jgi:hypothetical protein
MSESPAGLIVLGLLIGIIFLPAVDRAYWKIALLAPTDGRDNKSQALVLLAGLVASLVGGIVVLGPLYAFGYIPLWDQYNFFAWPFLFGLVLSRLWQWLKKASVERGSRV